MTVVKNCSVVCASFGKVLRFKKEKWRCSIYATIQKGWYEVAGKEEDPEGLWSRSAKFCVLKVENVLCNYTKRVGIRLLEKNDLPRNGFCRKRRSFGEINKW